MSRDAIKGRINQIKTEIENTDSDFDREKLQERLAKLAGGVAVVKVGAATETEMKEKKHRVEDALQATRAALEEGIVPGGGVALLRAQDAIKLDAFEGDERTGAQIIYRSLEEPLRQIADNAGLEGSVVVNDVRNAKGKNHGPQRRHRRDRRPGRRPASSTPPWSRAPRCRTRRRSGRTSSRPRRSSPRCRRRTAAAAACRRGMGGMDGMM